MRRPLRYSPTARRGFTLVELLVSVALCIMIMAILATAFSIALDTLSLLKSIATLTKEQQAANTIMTRDFEAQHLEGPAGETVRVSDSFVATQAWSGNELKGFLRVRQGSVVRQDTSSSLPNGSYPTYPRHTTAAPVPVPPYDQANYPYLLEGFDSDNIPSYRATDHSVHLTVKLSGKTQQDSFATTRPATMSNLPSLVDQNPLGTQFVTKWAEVAYFLKPTTGLQTTVTDNGLPGLTLYTLYRRQRVLAPIDATVTTSPVTPVNYMNANADFAMIQSAATTVTAVTPATITTAANRLNLDQAANNLPSYPNTMAEYGSDVLLTNVVSMQIRLIVDPVPTLFANDATNPQLAIPVNPAIPAWFYDTASATPLAAGVAKPRPRGIQIKLRIYDPKNRQTRQMNLTFAL